MHELMSYIDKRTLFNALRYLLVALGAAIASSGLLLSQQLLFTDDPIKWRVILGTAASVFFTAMGSMFLPKIGREEQSSLIGKLGKDKALDVLRKAVADQNANSLVDVSAQFGVTGEPQQPHRYDPTHTHPPLDASSPPPPQQPAQLPQAAPQASTRVREPRPYRPAPEPREPHPPSRSTHDNTEDDAAGRY